MSTIADIERLALDLSERDRAILATHLLRTLPGILHDDDEGVGEAIRRYAEFDSNPGIGVSLEELDRRVQVRRKG